MKRIILVGLSGSGKSAVVARLATRLDFEPIDIDDEIVRRFGMPVSEIFDRFGEVVFRAAETDLLRQACARERVVIAAGGGAVAFEQNWEAMRADSLIVHLSAQPGEIIKRLRKQIAADPAQKRPLLEADDVEATLASLYTRRKVFYERADVALDTTEKPIEHVVDEIVRMLDPRLLSNLVPVASIGVLTGRSDIYASNELIDRAGLETRQRWPEARVAWLISDQNVWSHWGEPVSRSFAQQGFDVRSRAVPAGESSKSLAQVEELLTWLLAGRIDRRDVVVAVGGGVVGDLAGFVASVVLRGVGLVQMPTSLLAMVDSSVGGKTGVNNAFGKNLIGSFYQPQLVLADPTFIRTLPERDLRSGWAEIIKHAMIERSATGVKSAVLLGRLEAIVSSDELRDPAVLSEVVAHNVRLKASVVQQDERESGLRRLLNYGHTLGHAMEADGYRYQHGEAIALGMRAVARISHRMGLVDADFVRRQDALIDAFGLPNRFEGSLEGVISRLAHDKKAVHGTITWILPASEVGVVQISRDVPLDLVRSVTAELGAS